MARDAAEMSPKLIPDSSLLPRDNSGGIDDAELNYTMVWGDGGKIMGGPKPHLSPTGSASEDTGERKEESGKRFPKK